MKIRLIIILIFSSALFTACEESDGVQTKERKEIKKSPPKTVIPTPTFDEDSTYAWVQRQVDFGPRVPGSEAHKACGDWMVKMMNRYCDEVVEQEAIMQAYNGNNIKIRNIIGIINPKAKDRILLCAHWDSRPFADYDSVRTDDPIDAANDGASGVAVLIEIARQISTNKIALGIDIIFFDAEDYSKTTEGYCLGSKHWSNNTHVNRYYAKYGILLDMVGGKDATFYMEQYSMEFAPALMRRIWDNASKLGYASNFVYEQELGVIDDHLYVTQFAKVPCIDIIARDKNTRTRFAPYWHTHGDNMSIIDKATLKAVGQTVLHTVYQDASDI